MARIKTFVQENLQCHILYIYIKHRRKLLICSNSEEISVQKMEVKILLFGESKEA